MNTYTHATRINRDKCARASVTPYARTHVYTYTSPRTRICLYMHAVRTCTGALARTYTHVRRTHVYIDRCTRSNRSYTHTACTYAYTGAHARMLLHARREHICVHTCLCTSESYMHVTCAYHFTRADALILPYTHVALCPIVHVQYLRVASVKGHIHACADASRYVSEVCVWENVNACAPVYVCVHGVEFDF